MIMNNTETESTTTRASLELLYHISREIATALDLPTVLQRVLFLSMRTIGAISGSIIVLDDNGTPVESAIIHGAQVLHHTTRQLKATLEHGLAGWVVNTRQAVLIPDTSQDERWLRRPDDADDATGPKSAVSAPFLTREHLVGVITLVHPTPGFFTLDHLALVQAIADQAAIAVLNARLYAESRRQARVMTALAESATAITATLNLEDVLQRILEQIQRALKVEAVSLALIDHKQGELTYQAAIFETGKSIVGQKLKMGQGIAGWVAKEGRGIIVPDAYKDSRFYPEMDKLIGFKTESIACAPIKSQGEVIGVVQALNPTEGLFDPDALLVLAGISSLAGSAIRHAQLFENLQAAHQRYRDLFEDSIDSILITDWKGHILEANRQTTILSDFDKENLRHMTIGHLHDLDFDKLGSKFENLSSGETISYQSILYAQSKREIPIEAQVHEVNVEGVSHLQWIFRDITERKNMDQIREDLLSMIYHDLRSPLANVVSSLDVLDSMLSLDDDPAIKSLFHIAVRSTERIQRLTNSLLDINRLEAGQPVVNTQPTDPHTLAEDAVEAVIPIAENKNQSIEINIPDDIAPVMVDGDMIRRVVINLLENAVKFSPPEGKIHIGAQHEDDWVRIWVQDSGPGIPPEDHKRIFDKYTRLHATGGSKGLGLGLAYCRLAVEGHGGRIWVENVPKSGAYFAFTLPVVQIGEGQ
jgi:NtrC-family two-component system sensor histidine kinase KinB